jgi:hypothetical protein
MQISKNTIKNFVQTISQNEVQSVRAYKGTPQQWSVRVVNKDCPKGAVVWVTLFEDGVGYGATRNSIFSVHPKDSLAVDAGMAP